MMDPEVWKKFEENNITHSAAHHLLAVMDLKKERGYARVTDVAKALNITTGSASTNLKSLKQKGLVVEDDNRFLTLSPQGEHLAKAVVARKEIFHKFLIDVLSVSPAQAEIDSCKTEHLLSHETCERLLAFMHSLTSNRKNKGGKLQMVNDGAIKCPHENGKEKHPEDCNVCEDHCLMEDC